MTDIPPDFDVLIIQQLDPHAALPSGVETVIRGILKYAPKEKRIGIIGADKLGPSRRPQLGKWEEFRIGGNAAWFLPVCRLASQDERRRIPHAFRLALGAIRYLREVPSSSEVHTHRADLGAFARCLWPVRSHRYFVHTQERGLLGTNSESIWRHVPAIHVGIEKSVVRLARHVHVFNPTYIAAIKAWNSSARYSPTWWDPDTTLERMNVVDPYSVLWVGRLERPKDPQLALSTFQWLRERYPDEPWRLTMIGSGSLMEELQDRVASNGLSDIVHLAGRRDAAQLGMIRASHHTMLMTSVRGYEGFPMVLVEGLAAGLPAVVTEGSDTGSLVTAGINGFACPPDPAMLGEALRDARELSADVAAASVAELSAPRLVHKIFEDDWNDEQI